MRASVAGRDTLRAVYVDRYKEIVGWGAAIIGIAAEGLMIWMIDQLPVWAQVLVYAPGAIGIVGGIVIIVRDRSRRRHRAKRSTMTPP
jgi:hypothetical protein